MVAIRFWVSGLVQGVGYRAYARRAAVRRGIGGYARNLADGRVEVMAMGEADAVAGLEEELRRGPPGGRVEVLERAEATSHAIDITRFDIR